MNHRSSTVDKKCSQVGVTSFADAQKRRLAATRMLSGHETQLRSELTSVVEILRIAHTGDQCRCRQRSDTWNLLQATAGLA